MRGAEAREQEAAFPRGPTVKPTRIFVKGEIPSTGPANWASWTQPAASPRQHALGLPAAKRAIDHDQQEGIDDPAQGGQELAEGGRPRTSAIRIASPVQEAFT